MRHLIGRTQESLIFASDSDLLLISCEGQVKWWHKSSRASGWGHYEEISPLGLPDRRGFRHSRGQVDDVDTQGHVATRQNAVR